MRMRCRILSVVLDTVMDSFPKLTMFAQGVAFGTHGRGFHRYSLLTD